MQHLSRSAKSCNTKRRYRRSEYWIRKTCNSFQCCLFVCQAYKRLVVGENSLGLRFCRGPVLHRGKGYPFIMPPPAISCTSSCILKQCIRPSDERKIGALASMWAGKESADWICCAYSGVAIFMRELPENCLGSATRARRKPSTAPLRQDELGTLPAHAMTSPLIHVSSPSEYVLHVELSRHAVFYYSSDRPSS